jgi:hypothetical protein
MALFTVGVAPDDFFCPLGVCVCCAIFAAPASIRVHVSSLWIRLSSPTWH